MPNSFSPLMVSRICERSITRPSAGRIEAQSAAGACRSLRRQGHDGGDRGGRLPMPGKDVQDHVSRVDLAQSLLAGRLDRGQAVAQNGSEDIDELAVAVGGATSLRRTRSGPVGRTQFLNGAPLRSAPGLRAHRHGVPWI